VAPPVAPRPKNSGRGRRNGEGNPQLQAVS
jgi:hypothetical protein